MYLPRASTATTAVVEYDLAAALEQARRVAGDAADHPELAVERYRFAKAHGELGGDAPGAGVSDRDRPADRLVEGRRRDAAVQTPRVALVMLCRP